MDMVLVLHVQNSQRQPGFLGLSSPPTKPDTFTGSRAAGYSTETSLPSSLTTGPF